MIVPQIVKQISINYLDPLETCPYSDMINPKKSHIFVGLWLMVAHFTFSKTSTLPVFMCVCIPNLITYAFISMILIQIALRWPIRVLVSYSQLIATHYQKLCLTVIGWWSDTSAPNGQLKLKACNSQRTYRKNSFWFGKCISSRQYFD